MKGSPLAKLRERGEIGALDAAFAALMARLGGGDAGVELAAALASRATGEGHVCLDLGHAAGRDGAPELAAWRERLRASPVVGEPGQWRPLVLDHADRLYLWRYWDYERTVAEGLLARAAPLDGVDRARLSQGLDRLFPADAGMQKAAAAVAALRRLAVISGGPGTGKTTTVARILALAALLAQGPAPRMALAAPTGKAAGRMQEAFAAARSRLDLPPPLLDCLPREASTLHRLLGARGDGSGFRHDAAHPLPLDLLVVDEASMVDVALMAALLRALPPAARLVLVGDRDQLASVEAGAVLGDVCAGGGFSPDLAAQLRALCGVAVPAGAGGLGDSIVLLERSWRFGPDSAIGRLARLANAGDAGGALELLACGAPDLAWQPQPEPAAFARRLAEALAPCLAAARAGQVPAAFAELARTRALCALRVGPWGAEAVNRAVEEIAGGGARGRDPWYPGRAVMVSRNDYALGLYNGDVGIAAPDAGGVLRVWFETPQGLRDHSPARLPEHETAYALTVHKSQGSEFDRVMLLLPPGPSPAVNRPLLYTAVTRARQAVEVWSGADALRAGIARTLVRSSGLREALWGR